MKVSERIAQRRAATREARNEQGREQGFSIFSHNRDNTTTIQRNNGREQTVNTGSFLGKFLDRMLDE